MKRDYQYNNGVPYKRTRKGLTTNMHSGQVRSSKTRGHDLPTYTALELREWVFNQPHFETMYQAYVDSGYDIMLIPSCDRIDDKLGYSFSNITLMTWKQNLDKAPRKLGTGKGSMYFANHTQAWVATYHVNGKQKHLKRSKDKQVVIDALEEYRKTLTL